MDIDQLSAKVAALEKQVAEMQKASHTAFNTDRVYDTQGSPYGYAQAVHTQGSQLVWLSGMTPWNKAMQLEEDTLIGQLTHALENLKTLLDAQGLTMQHLVSLRYYVALPNYYEHMGELAEVTKKFFGKTPIDCAMTLAGVTGLAEPQQLIEVEAVAAY